MNLIHKHKNISIRLETYDRLAKLGTLEDSFDAVITRLIDQSSRAGSSENPVLRQTKLDEF